MPKQLIRKISQHRYGLSLLAHLAAAVLTGMVAVGFMRAFEVALARRIDFDRAGGWPWLTTPLLFVAASLLVRKAAPCADGTGIPQIVFAVKNLERKNERLLAPLYSSATMAVKIAALLIGVVAGASTGREGPTVQVAACAFIGTLSLLRLVLDFELDLRSALIAGGAAGLAAAFNTPLAGVTFAIEELAVDYFANIKDIVILSIIVAATAAQTLTGEYVYFGRFPDPVSISIKSVLIIGLAGGVFGALFSTGILKGKELLSAAYRQPGVRYAMTAVLASLLLLLAGWTGTMILGPGNVPAQQLVQGKFASWALWFPFAKMAATLLTFWSGIAGGIFAPCLSIGAALGADVAHWTGVSVSSCAVVGMAAFLSGTIQTPITSFVILFEMCDRHEMLLPIMLSSLLAFMVARLLGARHLYPALAESYAYLCNS